MKWLTWSKIFYQTVQNAFLLGKKNNQGLATQFFAQSELCNEPFALLLENYFLTYSGKSIMSDLISGYEKTDKSQLSVMKINGLDISKQGVIVPDSKTGLA